MATIRRSGSGWQTLIRKKQYQGPRSRTFTSQAAAKLWANAVESSLKRPEKLDQPPPHILKEAIDLFIDGPLQEHRSGHNEQYPLRAMANSWIGGVPLSELSIRHFALWRDERLLQVKPNTIMRELRILRVLLDWAKDEQGCLLKSNPARELKVRGTNDARIPHLTKKQEQDLLKQLARSKNPNHLRLTQLALATGMRRSELLSMKWNDLDLERKLVYLTRKDCAAQGLQRSELLVPLSRKAVELLGQYPKEQQHIIGLSAGSARHGFDRARKAAGLNQLHFHDLRHLAISRMWAEGMSALEISEASGHRNLGMLLRYSHFQLGYGG